MAHDNPGLGTADLHTAGHVDCPGCAAERSLIYSQISSDLVFPKAFELWMSHRIIAAGYQGNAQFLSSRTLEDYRNCFSALRRFFSRLRLDQIHAGHLREYQRRRALNPPDPDAPWWCLRGRGVHGGFPTREAAEAWGQGHGGRYELRQTVWAMAAGANRIRKEVQLLLQILRAARCWGEAEEICFRPLRPVDADVRRAMDDEEEQRFLAAALSRPEWRLVYCYSVLALRTTCSTNELRALRLGAISLDHGYLQISREGAKGPARMRTIPLESGDVLHALGWLLERARELGAVAPFHYLFPFDAGGKRCDPARPMTESGLKKRWQAVRQAAGLEWLRPYDLRHTAITRMAEAGVPVQVIMSFAGHLTLRMQQHYTAVSMMARRRAAQAVWGAGAVPKFGAVSERDQVINRFNRRGA